MNTSAKSILERTRHAELLQTVQEPQASDDLGSFGWLPGIRDRAPMLELRKADGNALAVAYGWIEKITFDPSTGITLHGAGLKVRITGRQLNAEVRPTVRLFSGLARHRVSWIQEADEPTAMSAREGETVIDRIQWD